MNLLFRWGGAALIMAGALFINNEYKQYINRRISEYRGFLSLISHAEGKISKYLSYGDGLWRDFSDDSLDMCGFIPLLRGGCTVYDAFEKSKKRLSLSKETKEFLSSSFKDLGRGYREGEISYLLDLKSRLTRGLEEEEMNAEKNKKVATALLFGGALAILILAI